jgi:hypothetical protein
VVALAIGALSAISTSVDGLAADIAADVTAQQSE